MPLNLNFNNFDSYNRPQIQPTLPPKQSLSPNFCGFTRLVMHTPEHPRPFHTTEEFLKISSEFKSKIIGKLPKEFLTLFPGEPKKIIQFHNELSVFTRGFPCIHKLGIPKPPQEINLKLKSEQILKINYIDAGEEQKTFLINFPTKKFIFKTFKNKYKCDKYGAEADVKAGINLSGEDIKDVAKTHIGSFEKNHEWLIAEYIDKTDCLENRKGKLLKDARPELKNEDRYSYGNEINKIIVDIGGMQNKNQPQYYEYPQTAINKLEDCENINEREQIFYALLNDKNPENKIGLGYAMDALDWDKSGQYFYDILKDPHLESKIGLETNIDILPDQIKLQAYNDWIKYLKSQLTLCEADI